MSPKQVMINPKETSLVKKAEELVYARYELSELSIKVLSSMIAMLRADDEDFARFYVLRVKDFKELSGLSGRSVYENLKKVADELQSKPLTIKTGKDGDNSFLTANWLASYEYVENSGEIELEISYKLKPYLLQLKERFLEYGLANILRLKSSYVIRLYEILKHEHKKHSAYKDGASVEFSIEVEELKKIFMIPESYQYGNIKTRILLPAQEQFLKESDISFTFEEQKRGRGVKSIKFIIIENEGGTNDPLKNLDNFISWTRRKRVNDDIYIGKDKKTGKEMILSVDEGGRLYDKLDITKEIGRERAQELWQSLFKIAKETQI